MSLPHLRTLRRAKAKHTGKLCITIDCTLFKFLYSAVNVLLGGSSKCESACSSIHFQTQTSPFWYETKEKIPTFAWEGH